MVREVVLELGIDQRRLAPVDLVDAVGVEVHGDDVVVLGEYDCVGEADITQAHHGDLHAANLPGSARPDTVRCPRPITLRTAPLGNNGRHADP
ncbi:hypothetical protein GCM10022415_04590 [Knoellia locipacati]|uniref:Uncharacterized protein n=1 Tax=Knoellia locipacati TaxID=882824 RepID=A0A512SWS7_9MICO|nr:hypothetical protein KLO01_04570 [Knoellia locipacati]